MKCGNIVLTGLCVLAYAAFLLAVLPTTVAVIVFMLSFIGLAIFWVKLEQSSPDDFAP